ncbi:hypothetical protein PsYK624_082420 [Phanerochaete sordida]|uniref:Protein kinase domain-containing protein n=1 Tax=Phanerochaete sordida TaxID=48140 RepID=A0A9P3GE54_9APHY|nr:hypothetical protein PsYK624_082420 [Phanerochaete sordida]
MSDTVNFLGPMPASQFLERFMRIEDSSEAARQVELSHIAGGLDAVDMSQRLIHTVETHALCPSLRLFLTRTKKKQRVNTSPSEDSDCSIFPDLCAPLAARKRPKSRRSQTGKRNLVEYINFANVALQVEVRHSSDDDPFVVPPSESCDEMSWKSCSSNPSSPSHSSCSIPKDKPTSSASPTPPQSPHTSTRNQQGQPPGHGSPRSPTPLTSAGLTAGGKTLRTALTNHAYAQFTCQHRVFFFHLILVGRHARFLRWDRSGAIVSERFDYASSPELLCDFLWRFSHMDEAQQGWDTTVSRPSKAEVKLFRDAVKAIAVDMKAGASSDGAPVRQIPHAERSLDETGVYPFWKIHVVNSDTGRASELIVNRPLSANTTACGRATRAYLAYDLQLGRMLFFKDSWRHNALLPEYTTFRELYAHDVPHVLEVLYGGDVVDGTGGIQMTLSQRFYADEDRKRIVDGQVVKRIHHRIVQEIAFPLKTAVDEREFIQAMHDALCALEKAYDAGFLHRDVSFKNIMITSSGRGVLNDWDHAGRTDQLSRGIGTWQFMSIALQRSRDKKHDILDDLESVFWVLLYGLHTRFTVGHRTLAPELFDNTPAATDAPGGPPGARHKHSCIMFNELARVHFSEPALDALAQDCAYAWKRIFMAADDSMPEQQARTDVRIVRDAAPRPAFWREKFAKALENLPARCGREAVADAGAAVERPCSAGNKRKKRGDDEKVQPRRSRRIQLLQGRR